VFHKSRNFLFPHSVTHVSRTDVFHAVSLPSVFTDPQLQLQCKLASPRWGRRM